MRRRNTRNEAKLAGYLIVGVICFPILLIYWIFKGLEGIANFCSKFSDTNINQKFNIKFSENVQEQLNNIDFLDGWQFENYIACLLKKIGYRNVNVTSGSGDFGADIVAEKNGEKTAFQCKRFADKVGPKVVGEVLRGMNRYNCTKGIIVTNNYFTEQAIKEAKISNIELWDREKIISILNNDEKENSLNSNQLVNMNKKILCPHCKSKNNSTRTNCWVCGKSILNTDIINESNNNDEVEKKKLFKELSVSLSNLKDDKELQNEKIDSLESKYDIVNNNSNYIDKINNIKLSAGEYEIPEDLKPSEYNIYLVKGEGSISLEDNFGELKKFLNFGNKNTYQITEYNNLKICEGDNLEIKDNCILVFEKVENRKADLNNIKAGIYKISNNMEPGKYKIILKRGEGSISLEDNSGELKKFLNFGNKNTYQITEYNNLKIYEGDCLEIKDNCIFQFIKNSDIKNNEEHKNTNIVEEKGKDEYILKKDIVTYDTPNKSKGKMDAITYIIENIEYSYYSFENLLDELKKEGFSEELSINAIENCEIDWKEQALKCAKENLEYNNYSYKSLMKELIDEKFTEEQVKYAIENCNVNWNEQALKYANEMISYSDDYTPTELRDDLECEDYEEENIKYALKNCKVDWNAQAVKTAKQYRKENMYSREEIIEFLREDDGYTSSQAQYGIKNSRID